MVAGGEPGTQETQGQGGKAGNCSQVGCAGEPPGRDVLCAGWHGPVGGGFSPLQLSSHPGAALGQLCLCAVGWWWGDAIHHLACMCLGSRQSRQCHSPTRCEWCPTVRPSTPPRRLPNGSQIYICFISVQRCLAPRAMKNVDSKHCHGTTHHLIHPHQPCVSLEG